MRRITSLVAATGLALAAVAATAGPALAAGSATTPTSFQVNAGALSISAPASVTFAAVTAGATTVGGQIGNVTVTDNRGLLIGLWTATVTSTDFVSTNTTIPAANINYSAGTASTTGNISLNAPGAGPLSNSTALTAQSSISLLGSGTATWNPTLAITIPLSATAGTYVATLTHSVA
jgi:hypothetical protein